MPPAVVRRHVFDRPRPNRAFSLRTVKPCAACESLLSRPLVFDLPAHLKRSSPMSAGADQTVPPPILQCVNCHQFWGWTRARGVFRLGT